MGMSLRLSLLLVLTVIGYLAETSLIHLTKCGEVTMSFDNAALPYDPEVKDRCFFGCGLASSMVFSANNGPKKRPCGVGLSRARFDSLLNVQGHAEEVGDTVMYDFLVDYLRSDSEGAFSTLKWHSECHLAYTRMDRVQVHNRNGYHHSINTEKSQPPPKKRRSPGVGSATEESASSNSTFTSPITTRRKRSIMDPLSAQKHIAWKCLRCQAEAGVDGRTGREGRLPPISDDFFITLQEYAGYFPEEFMSSSTLNHKLPMYKTPMCRSCQKFVFRTVERERKKAKDKEEDREGSQKERDRLINFALGYVEEEVFDKGRCILLSEVMALVEREGSQVSVKPGMIKDTLVTVWGPALGIKRHSNMNKGQLLVWQHADQPMCPTIEYEAFAYRLEGGVLGPVYVVGDYSPQIDGNPLFVKCGCQKRPCNSKSCKCFTKDTKCTAMCGCSDACVNVSPNNNGGRDDGLRPVEDIVGLRDAGNGEEEVDGEEQEEEEEVEVEEQGEMYSDDDEVY